MTKAVLGIIGGSGIYDLPGLEKVRQKRIKSPWGEPSAPLRVGEIAGLPVVFLSRHDKGHRLSPSDINYRANIDVLKRAGVTDLVSLSACGSFKQELPPGTFVLVDQFVDRTHNRASSFFGKGCVAHVSMAHPVSPLLQDRIAAAACFLPLSMNPVLSTQMGTRHRAGIGVTEETDAVAVIVSEETGAISLAVKGNIERDLTVERLRERLSQLLRRYAPAPTLPTPVEENLIEDEPPSSHPTRRHDSNVRPGADD